MVFAMKLHIQSFNAHQRHYSFNRNKNVRYLPETLSIIKMHSMDVLVETPDCILIQLLVETHIRILIQSIRNLRLLIFLKKKNVNWRLNISCIWLELNS